MQASDLASTEPLTPTQQLMASGHSMLNCRKALSQWNNDVTAALKWLNEGHWRQGKLISWNHEALDIKAAELHAQTGKAVPFCKEVLMDCAGNVESALGRLQPPSRRVAVSQ